MDELRSGWRLGDVSWPRAFRTEGEVSLAEVGRDLRGDDEADFRGDGRLALRRRFAVEADDDDEDDERSEEDDVSDVESEEVV